jgi:hypothetical protein
MAYVNLSLIPAMAKEAFTVTTLEGEVEHGWRLSNDVGGVAKMTADGKSWMIYANNHPMYVYIESKQEGRWLRLDTMTPTRLKDDEKGLLAWRAEMSGRLYSFHTMAWNSPSMEPIGGNLGIRWYSPHIGVVATI